MEIPEPPIWRRVLPDKPGRRYSFVAGANTWAEWVACLPRLLSKPDPNAVIRFESRAARLTGSRHAITFGAGRMGLYAALSALEFNSGDEIIVPAFTCVVIPNAMRYLGLKPVYADIDPVTFNIDPGGVEALIGPRTRAIIAQHTFGTGCDIDSLRNISDRNGLVLIEDAAHSQGATIMGRPHGSDGDLTIFSTDRTKVINNHVGGFVTTSDDRLALSIIQIRDSGYSPGKWRSRRMVLSFLLDFLLRDPLLFWIGRPALGALRRCGAIFQWQDEPFTSLPGGYPYPSSMSPSLAELGLLQLDKLETNLAHRRRIARLVETYVHWYADRLGDQFEEQAWLRYSFLVRDRAEFCRRFGRKLELGIWFPGIIYGGEGREEELGYEWGSCPIAEKSAASIVNLATHPRIPILFMEKLLDEHYAWLQDNVVHPGAE